MTTLRTRATPIFRTEPIRPAVKSPPAYTMNGEVVRDATLRLHRLMRSMGIPPTPKAEKWIDLPPPTSVDEQLPEPAVPLTLPQVYDRLLRVFDAQAQHVASGHRKSLGGARCWWNKPTLHEMRQVIWAVMRSYKTPTGVASYPEIARLTRPRGMTGSHSTVITSIKRWAMSAEAVGRAVELARRAGLGESAVRRVRDLADAEYAKRARVSGGEDALK